MALRARSAGNKKAHTGVAVWAFTLSRYRAGGLLELIRVKNKGQRVDSLGDQKVKRLSV